jgi:peptidoglycan/LPS O-acetylase OafA/YrhL
MRKAIFLVVLSVSFIVTLVIWLAAPSTEEKLPAEDEMSKNIMKRGTATSYHLSLFLWLVILYFADKTRLECHTLIAAGIMGMAILFVLSWLYHRYIRRTHD